MKRLLLALVMVSGFVYAETVDYGYFSRPDSKSEFSPKMISIKENEIFIYLKTNNGAGDVKFDVAYPNIESFVEYDFTTYQEGRNESKRTIVGPCKIFPKESHKPLIINYKIIKYKGL